MIPQRNLPPRIYGPRSSHETLLIHLHFRHQLGTSKRLNPVPNFEEKEPACYIHFPGVFVEWRRSIANNFTLLGELHSNSNSLPGIRQHNPQNLEWWWTGKFQVHTRHGMLESYYFGVDTHFGGVIITIRRHFMDRPLQFDTRVTFR